MRFQMFDVVSIARATVFEGLEEGVVVLNENDIVVDYNQAMKTVLPALTVHTVGRPLREVISANDQLASILCQGEECDYKLDQPEETLHFQVRFPPLKDEKGEMVGKIVMFINVTERVQMEK